MYIRARTKIMTPGWTTTKHSDATIRKESSNVIQKSCNKKTKPVARIQNSDILMNRWTDLEMTESWSSNHVTANHTI